jgi:hypothetical protein
VRRLSAALVLALGACAQPGAPPGGPERHIPPKLVSVTPDSGAVNARVKEVVIRFDEVVSEKPAGQAPDLSGLALVSPSDGLPRVGWHREALSIRGRHDFLPNTAYTVTLLPGLADLHGNVLKTPVTVVFSTGDSIPDTRVAGLVFDRVTAKPIPNAMVRAVQRPDSALVYLARADSTGQFELLHAPAGTYTLQAWNDANNNRLVDPHEAWDSVHLALRDTARVELLAFAHDTVGPRIDQFAILDSTSLKVTFDRAIDTAQTVDTSMFTLRRADSTVVPLRGVEKASVYDSIHAATAPKDTSHARADSARKAAAAKAAAAPPPTTREGRAALARTLADSVRRAHLPKPSRPSPITAVVVLVAEPLQPGVSYRLEARDVRNLQGFKASPSHAFAMPKPTPPPAPGAKPAPRGATKAPGAAKTDTTHKPTGS